MSKIMSKFISVLAVSVLLAYPAKAFANDTLDDELTNLEEPKKETKKEVKKEVVQEDDLEDLLNSDISAGSAGSFGYNLNKENQELGIEPYIHAYSTFDAKKETVNPFTFDNLYYNLFVGVNIKDLIATEVQYEHEHGSAGIAGYSEVRVGQVDLLVNPLLNFRVGKFLVPVGSFNPYLYPEYITKGAMRPFALREIIPVTWSDTGVQIFGKYEFGIGKDINYSLFAINGLKEQLTKDEKALADADANYVANIRKMRNNSVETEKSDKGLGGRVGITPIDGLEISFSGYTGSYTADSSKRLSMGDIDLVYEVGNFSFRSEYVYAMQQTKGTDAIKKGGYAQVSYLLKPVEPVIRFDMIDFSNDPKHDRQRIAVGLNYYPIYDTYKKFVVKAWYSYTMQKDLKEPNSFYFQTSLGF